MIVPRLLRLANCNSRQFLSALQKYQSPKDKVIQSRNVSTNLQVVRRFAQSCWKCETTGTKNSIICEKCGALMSPSTTKNYFELLDVVETFDVNSTKLTENFRKLQSVVHPDKFSNKSDVEQKHAMDWSSLLNKAYSTLSTPFKRAEYMLSIKDVTMPERNETLNPEFLMEMMERNEEVAELRTRSQCNEYLDKLKIELKGLYEEFAQLLEKDQVEEALLGLIRIRYVNNLEKKIKEKLYELND